MIKILFAFVFVLPIAVGGCGDSGCRIDGDCAATPDTPSCEPVSAVCVAKPTLVGPGDGSVDAVSTTQVFQEDRPRRPTGFSFHPQRGELWIVNYMDDSVFILTNPGQPDQRWEKRHDQGAPHFMHKPTAISFGQNNAWGVCGDNDNENDPNPAAAGFMGPSLFSGDLATFAKFNETGLGTHLDMLHDSPHCMGITHEQGNAYWVFDGEHSSLTRYDFQVDHGPGNDDHSDGIIRRYVEGQVRRVEGLPSHLTLSEGMLYVSDTGNHRVLRLDTSSGTMGEEYDGKEPAAERRKVDGAQLDELVSPGTVDAPTGIAVADGVLYVGDRTDGQVHAFDLEGKPLRVVDTGLGPDALNDLSVGPDGRLWLLDGKVGAVLVVD